MSYARVKESADFIASKIKISPLVGVVLGSGLGVYADEMQDKVVIPYGEIPNFHKPTVVGHEGRLVAGTIAGVPVIAYQGRFHAYEGHSLEDVVLPVRTMAVLGIKYCLLTNAAGGINFNFAPGDLVAIVDHINLTGKNPLLGPNEDKLGPRFPDMTYTYDRTVMKVLQECANACQLKLHTGVYAGLLGPTYETPAEIKMLRTLGADMVGMSTVPEAIAANHAGLKLGGISCITNMGAGMKEEKLDHADVKDVANKATKSFSMLLTKVIEKLGILK